MKNENTTQIETIRKFQITSIGIGLVLLILSQLLLSFGYDFLMSQRPIDFAHWAMFFASLMLFGLWFTLPNSLTKRTGLIIMTIGIGGITGMCCIDFILWAANDNAELKNQIFQLISENASIRLPFLVLGPTLFYMGIGIATYGLIKKHTWQVIILNIGLLMIGLGHMIFQNRTIPVIGAIILFFGLMSILVNRSEKENETQQRV